MSGSTARFAAACGLFLLLAGCIKNPPAEVLGVSSSPAGPGSPWVPPEGFRPTGQAPEKPPVTFAPGSSLSLADIVNIALGNSPDTRATWANARAMASAYGSELGSYYPEVTLRGNYLQSQLQQGVTGGPVQRSYSPAVDLSFLLYDFGGRGASVEEAKQALLAADFAHNAKMQDVILTVEQGFYRYLAAKAMLKAEGAAVKEAESSLEAAQERHRAGLATIADVLQAKTALSRATLAMQTTEGSVMTTRGALATAMGLPANTPFDIEVPDFQIPSGEVEEAVEDCITSAQALRPELAQAAARVAKAEAHVKNIRAEGLPSLSLGGTASRYYPDSRDGYLNGYTAGIYLRFPLFTGFSNSYEVLQAKEEAETARAEYEMVAQRVLLEVWQAYYQMKTSGQKMKTAEDLLKSATESHDVAMGRYKAGVGDILDLLAAQNSLESARAERVLAVAEWFVSAAQLARETGRLWSAQRETPEIRGNITRIQ